MLSRKGGNVVAFPLSRRERIAPRAKLFEFGDGKIAALPVLSAEIINLQEAAERIRARCPAASQTSRADANTL